jgi:hypothetical protein
LKTNETTIIPGRYRHYKGNEYQVLATARHSETEELLVIYRCLADNGSLWVRPLKMFHESIMINGRAVPRFTLVEAAPAGEREEGGSDLELP